MSLERRTRRPIRPDLGPIFRARFLDRPNRFLVRCSARGRGVFLAHLPNPGRLWELFLPGVTLYLNRAKGGARKTTYTVVGVERDGLPIFLHTHLTNDVVRELLVRQAVPGLEAAEVVKSEVPVGRSRFDFLLRLDDRDVYLEVKSCTLFGNDVAMFPDAITSRGRRHLLELADLARKGCRCMVLFAVHSPRMRWFMPDYHTDLAFSRTLIDVRNEIDVLALGLPWNEKLQVELPARLLDIPWEYIEREAGDRGAYLLLLHLCRCRRVKVGALGTFPFEPGYYIYVGSAMANLSARIARHKRKRKVLRWHVDYLRKQDDGCVAIPIRASTRQECTIAEALGKLYELGPRGFGSSDCTCASHLLYSRHNPLESAEFHELLQRFRMQPPR